MIKGAQKLQGWWHMWNTVTKYPMQLERVDTIGWAYR